MIIPIIIKKVTVNIFKTNVKYGIKGNFIISLSKNALRTNPKHEKAIDIIIVDVGSHPNLSTIYANGRLNKEIDDRINSYFFIFPVARAAAIIGPLVASTKPFINANWVNITAYTGTSLSHKLKTKMFQKKQVMPILKPNM